VDHRCEPPLLHLPFLLSSSSSSSSRRPSPHAQSSSGASDDQSLARACLVCPSEAGQETARPDEPSFDAFNKRANAKAVVGATDVLSKLKHMVHFIKKGALSGDDKAAAGLQDVLKDMGSMIH